MPDTKISTKGEKTRATILEAAHILFLKNGFHGTSMRQIADEAGLALGGLYNYFDSKEKIFGEVLDAHHPYHIVMPALEKTEGETIEEFVGDMALKVRAGIEGAEDELMPLVFIDLLEFRGRYIKRIAVKIIPPLLLFFQRFGTRKGKMRKISRPVMLRALMGIIVGYLISEMIIRDIPLAKHQMPRDSFEQMIEIYLHGIVQE
ncbi:MAG: TetR/AcrR family transcriptional regulator [Chloroflexi bacterium]|nr:TetR/AcrR family transcriptional regulator [Chloroflexota bacterium]MBI5081431.1 TetR/AcrR family transcriptional regulator [Chloroflexota bacterium]MBI5350319.1 TetR/AcrR family transcriptional regulator [Chloroflexota bacterium]MBI5715431.1 TetR/AcrR family transcriptional regulator [Chloroflexota bacterium]